MNFIKKFKYVKRSSVYQSNMYYYAINGILYTLVCNLYKSYAQKFIYRINGNDTHVSLYNSLPGLVAAFVVIPGIIYMCRAVSKKKALSGIFFLSRFCVLLYAAVPFLPSHLQAITFVIITALMNLPESVSTTSLQSFTADVFSERERATAITYRNKYNTFASLISMIILSQILKIFGTTNEKSIGIYQIFFVVAFFIGLLEIYTFTRLKETEQNEKVYINFSESIREVFRDKKYLSFLACSLTFHFGWQMGWPLFGVYQISYLNADETWLTILSVTSSIVMFFSYGYWHRIIDKKGNNFAIALATLGMAATPILYVLSTNLYILTLSGLIMGFFTAGTSTVILTFLLEVSPGKNRIMYVAVHAALTNLTLFIAPLVGDAVLSASNIIIALLVTALMRFVGSFTFYFKGHRKKATMQNM